MERSRTLMAVVLAAAVVLASWPQGALAAPPGAEARAQVKGNNAFALDLYAKLKETPGNLFFSPYSISTALAMTYAGARANTEAQMAKVLHFGLGQDRLHGVFQAVMGALNAGGKKGTYQLSVANALWGQQGYTFLDPFLDVTRTKYDGGLRQVDFKTAPEPSRKRINHWVEKQTQDKIRNLIPQGLITGDTRLVLTNAIYFKGDWQSPFSKGATRDAPFTLADGTTVQAKMMAKTRRYGYMETPQFQALDVPYAGGELSMVVFLPRKPDGLAAFEKALTPGKLAKWLRQVGRTRTVRTFLPRFKMTSMFRLEKVLAAMGMDDAFSPTKADFSGMTGKRAIEYGLYIAAVVTRRSSKSTRRARRPPRPRP